MTKMSKFGDLIREIRKTKGLTLDSVATALKIDVSTLCKIEKNERNATRNMIINLASVLETDKEKLLVSFYSDRIAKEIWKEENVDSVLKLAEEKVKYLKSTSIEQQQINF